MKSDLVKIKHERIIIEHEFGHILGLQFAPNALPGTFPQPIDKSSITKSALDTALDKWRKAVGWDNWMSQVVKTYVSTSQQAAYGPPPTVHSATILPTQIERPVIEKDLLPDSVMVFDWENEISSNDLAVIANFYPFPVSAIAFGVQDAFDRSLTGNDIDIALYAVSTENTLHRNTRSINKTKATSKPTVVWSGWESLSEEDNAIRLQKPGVANPVTNFKVRALVALEHSDRLEFFLACDDDQLYTNAIRAKDNAWVRPNGWQPVNHGKNPLKLFNANNGWQTNLPLEPTTILRAVEVEGGANVFFITDKGVLGTIFRKANEEDVPEAFHPVSGGSKVVSITSARIGAPTITNPPRIVATTASDVFLSLPSRSKNNWSVEKSGVIEADTPIVRLATGMASSTQHVLVIDDKGKIHQNYNKEGWASWDDGFNSINVPQETFISISVGVISSNDKEDGYLYAFAVSSKGQLWVSKVDDEDSWSEWTTDLTKFFGAAKSIKVPANIKRVITKRTRCGDLEIFLLAPHPKFSKYDVIYELSLNHEGISAASLNNGGFASSAWWNPQVALPPN